MQEDIFGLLMLILMMQCGSGTGNMNQLVLMFLLMQSRNGRLNNSSNDCDRDEGFTF